MSALPSDSSAITAAGVARAARAGDVERYFQVLAGPRRRGRLLEVRYARPGGRMGRRFVPAERLDLAARLIRALSPRTDVYVAVALRARRAGGRDAVAPSHLAWVEIDAPDAADRLARFAHPPSMIVASGTPGHLHAYWALRTPAAPAALEGANRRLAHHLGGDLASVDAARILRPPGSRNHKHHPAARVELLALRAGQMDLEQLGAGLADPPAKPAKAIALAPARSWRHPLDEALLAVPARQYLLALAGLQASRAGKVSCPFHPDDTPSLQLYQDATWFCFGCQRGGSIYDFAGELWHLGTKGREFIQLRARLASQLGIHPAPAPKSCS